MFPYPEETMVIALHPKQDVVKAILAQLHQRDSMPSLGKGDICSQALWGDSLPIPVASAPE